RGGGGCTGGAVPRSGRVQRVQGMSGRPSVAEQVPAGGDTLGTRLRVELERRGLSLRELARRLEVSPSLVSQIETGKTQPSVRTLYAIVTELGGALRGARR